MRIVFAYDSIYYVKGFLQISDEDTKEEIEKRLLELRKENTLTSLDEDKGNLYEGKFAWTFIDPRIANMLMKEDYLEGFSSGSDEGDDVFIRTVLQFAVNKDFKVAETEVKKFAKQYSKRAYSNYNRKSNNGEID